MQSATLLLQHIQMRSDIETVSCLAVSTGAKLVLACPGSSTIKGLVPFLLQLDKALLPSDPTKLFCNVVVRGRKSPLPHPTSNSRSLLTEVPHTVNLAGNTQENRGIPSIKIQDTVVCACSKANNILKYESLL